MKRPCLTIVTLAQLALAAPAALAQDDETPAQPDAAPQQPRPSRRSDFARWPGTAAPAVEAPPEVHTFVVDRNARPRFTVAALGRTSYLRDSGYHLFSTDDTSQGAGALVGYDVIAAARGALGIGVGFLSESIDGRGTESGASVFAASGMRASLDMVTVFAEARARWALLSWLQPHAHVTAGATRGAMTITTSSGSPLEGKDWAPSGSAGAGLTFRSPPIRFMSIDGHPAFALSFAIEGGYAAGGALKLVLSSDRPIPAGASAKDLIATQSVNAGELGRSFPYASGTLALHF